MLLHRPTDQEQAKINKQLQNIHIEMCQCINTGNQCRTQQINTDCKNQILHTASQHISFFLKYYPSVHLIFVTIAGNRLQKRHIFRCKSPQSRLGILNFMSAAPCKNLLCQAISHTTFPWNTAFERPFSECHFFRMFFHKRSNP